ncbi:unnamed protein product [Triticum turgidum subsp. durum]|uniref:non-specific serine/threonine protein kinase n=1 Tax=Triticum turgidum subsp. durum TaxID=4567 RepID=A0A9R0V5W4_TRITD|nr:unnamed protein product [Triticum turgidum subsp. durum]
MISTEDGYEFQRAELDAPERVVRDTSAEPMSLTLPLLRHITNDFSDESQIGQGGFAVVYLGVLPSGLRIAVKKLRETYLNDCAFQNEVFITMKATHKNTVRFMGYCSHTEAQFVALEGQHVLADVRQRLICVEYVPNGTLDTHIGDYGELDWNQRYQILKGICQGLRHLHDEVHVIHGDIKPNNILIDDKLMPKIIDFGLSQSFDEGQTSCITKNIIGTIGYMAPELRDKGIMSFKAEMYSLGVVITEFLTGERPPGPSVDQVLKELRRRLVKEGAFSSWENKYHQVRTCLEIGYTCTEHDPDRRPTALEIIQRLDETESTNHSAPSLWQSGDEESDSPDTEALDTETTTEFFPIDEEPASADTTGETSTQEGDMADLLSRLSMSAELSSLDFLEKITDDFSHERIIGKDGTFKGSRHKAFVYKGDIPRQEMVAVKRLIGVAIPVEKFRREAKQFISLDHKNIVKVASYCNDESGGQVKDLAKLIGKCATN